jgi:hypothetical protein
MPVTLVCQYAPCGKPFQVRAYRVRDGSAKYCSIACRGLANRIERTLEEQRALEKKYRINTRDHVPIDERRARYRAWYHAHREERIASNRRYKAEHAEDIRAQQRAHKREVYRQDPMKFREKNLAYYVNNTEKVRQQTAAYQRSHPEQVRAYQKNRRSKRQQTVNDFTYEQWTEMLEFFKHRCAYCGKKPSKLEMEHMTPISKGGAHTASNIVPACRTCNAKKHAGPVPVPIQPMLLTVAPPKPIKKRQQ